LRVDGAAEVSITISDTGQGIEESARVFEPYYTTKPAGQGTGLGLAICKQLVEGMHGRIGLESQVGVGTSVTIVLPRSTRVATAPPSDVATAGGPRLRVLVVDDEPLVREGMRRLLELEHEVDEAESGEAALAKLGEGSYDVLICDLMMPHMSGRELHDEVRLRHPGLERRVIFVTGGAFVPALAGFLDSVRNLRLHKPFTSVQLQSIVRAAHRHALGWDG
jgi:CheY-like chemotaxis protein